MVSHGAASSTIRWKVAAIVLGSAAVLCLAAGIALPYVTAGVFEQKLADLLPISPQSVSYSSWASSELRFQVWMWNLTNAREVLNSGAAPNLTQVGPFTFRETRVREEIQFYANKTVGYDDVRTYYFLPEESVGNLPDYRITNVNLPYIGVALRTKWKSISVRKIIQGFLASGVFTTRTVEELLLGYEDTKMRGLSTMARYYGGMKVPTRFGIMLGKNGTAKGSALVGTGSGSIGELNRIYLWNRQSSLKIWGQDWANGLVGTDGTMFPPPIGPDDTLAVFTPDLCRSANMTYRRTSTVQGITVLAFSPAKTALMNATGNPHNAAFCTPRCLDSGVLNLSLCLPGGPPIVASAPHFYGAPTYAAAVTGVSPGASHEFETRLELEPNTGLLLRAARRMQINVALEFVDGFPDTKRFGDLFLMPYLWLNESGAIGPEPAARFKQRVLRPLRLANLISWLLLALGVALLIVACVVCGLEQRLRSAQRMQRQRQQQQQQQQDSRARVTVNGANKVEISEPFKKDDSWQKERVDKEKEKGSAGELRGRESEAEELLKHLPETAIMS